jgi:hypothetical protein
MKIPQKLTSTPTAESLKKWNTWVAVLLGLQALAILLLTANKTYPVNVSYLTLDSLQSTTSGTQVLVPAVHHLFELNMARLVAAFLLIPALVHVSMATWYRLRYETDLANGMNRMRWFEYAISGGLMFVAIAALVGMSDLVSLGLGFALAAVTCLLGYVMETHNPFKKRAAATWTSYVVGATAGGLAWAGITVTLLASSLLGSGNMPAVAYWVYGASLVLFGAFAVNLYLQYKNSGPWSNYRYSEWVYLVLGFVTKSLLAWLIFAGTLRP